MPKTTWVKQALVGLLSLSVAATLAGCLADASSTEGSVETDPGSTGGVVGDPGGRSGRTDVGAGRGRATVAQPNRVRLPIVLLHGAAGFDDIGPIDYFAGVQDRLRLDGYQAFTTAVSPLDLIEVGAAQLAVQIARGPLGSAFSGSRRQGLAEVGPIEVGGGRRRSGKLPADLGTMGPTFSIGQLELD